MSDELDENELENEAFEPKEEKLSPDPQTVIAKLQGELAAERAARVESERRAASASVEVQDSQLALVTNALDALKQNSEVLKQNYAVALSSGDFTQAAEIQEQIADNASKRIQLEQGKQQLEIQAKQPRRAPEHILDPVEKMARTLTPRSAAWLRAHPQFADEGRMTRRMLAAHNLAVTDDVPVDTDEYFAHVERTLGLRSTSQAAAADPQGETARVRQRRDSAPPSAPTAAMGSNSGFGSDGRIARLSPAEREMARFMKLTDEEYARNKADLIKIGKMN